MSGHVGDLSPRQAEILEKFRSTVKDVLRPKDDDHFLLRWLRARNFDAKKAEAMLRSAMEWRKQIGADKIKNFKEPEVLNKYRTGGILPGRDKAGCPIYVDPYGLIDLKGLLRSVKKLDLTKKFVQVMEEAVDICEEETKRRGMLVDQMIVIYDLNCLNKKHLWKPAVDLYLELVDAAESRYPEILKKVFVINSPKMFPIIWHLVRPMLHEATAKKVVVYTTSMDPDQMANNYQQDLLKMIDASQLPACYGGTLTDPNGDPKCGMWVHQGGIVPKDCYSQASPKEEMTCVTVSRGSSLQLEYEVHEPNSLMRYEFHSEDHDVGFGVFRRTDPSQKKVEEMEAILSTQRANSHMVPEDGILDCKEPGTYIVRFDNTYSMVRSKKVHYMVEVLEPDTGSDEFEMASEQM